MATRLSRHETKDFKRRRGILHHYEVIPRLLSPGVISLFCSTKPKNKLFANQTSPPEEIHLSVFLDSFR